MKLSPPLPYVSCNYRERSIYDAIVMIGLRNLQMCMRGCVIIVNIPLELH